jgi:hypothetical protein
VVADEQGARVRTVGQAKRGDVEVRSNDLGIDEIVAHDAHVHVEMMGRREACLIIETAKERVWFWMSAKGLTEYDRCRVNRRAEAARRRENRKKLVPR